MLSREDLATISAAVRADGPPSSGDNLLGIEMDFHAFLHGADSEARPVWRDLAVRRLEDHDWLIEATARGDAAQAATIGARLVEIWESSLRYGHLEAHTLTTSPDRVVLEAITQSGPGQMWVTARVIVTLE